MYSNSPHLRGWLLCICIGRKKQKSNTCVFRCAERQGQGKVSCQEIEPWRGIERERERERERETLLGNNVQDGLVCSQGIEP